MKTAFYLAKKHKAQMTGVTLSAIKLERVRTIDETTGEVAVTSRIGNFNAVAGAESLVVKSKMISG